MSQYTFGGGDPTATHSSVRSEFNGVFIKGGRLRSSSNHLFEAVVTGSEMIPASLLVASSATVNF